jgi:rubrerythrin
MNTPIRPDHTLTLPPRRHFLTHSVQLSAAAVALLSGRHALAAAQPSAQADTAADVAILNAALAAEHRAIAAYQVGAESGLLLPPSRDLALQFQGHHRAHAALLGETVEKLGGAPAAAEKRYAFAVETLHAEADVLRFAAGLERDAVSAYLAAVPKFGNRDLAHAAASILGDEAMHWAVLRHVLGEAPVPVAFVS